MICVKCERAVNAVFPDGRCRQCGANDPPSHTTPTATQELNTHHQAAARYYIAEQYAQRMMEKYMDRARSALR